MDSASPQPPSARLTSQFFFPGVSGLHFFPGVVFFSRALPGKSSWHSSFRGLKIKKNQWSTKDERRRISTSENPGIPGQTEEDSLCKRKLESGSFLVVWKRSLKIRDLQRFPGHGDSEARSQVDLIRTKFCESKPGQESSYSQCGSESSYSQCGSGSGCQS